MEVSSLDQRKYTSLESLSGSVTAFWVWTFRRNTIKPRSNGNANAIDFYSGLKLDGPLNKGMKTYVQVQKEQTLAEETDDVKTLRQWERNVLREVDENYDPDDDSSDEEAIAERARRSALLAEKEAEEEAAAAANKGAKGAKKWEVIKRDGWVNYRQILASFQWV